MSNIVKAEDSQVNLELVRKVLGCDDKTPNSELALAKAYCDAKGWDIMKKPIAIIGFNGKYQIIPTADAVKITASRAGWAGNDDYIYGPITPVAWTDKWGTSYSNEVPEWGQVTVYKVIGGVRCAFMGPRVYFKERDARNKNWGTQPMAMFNKCILVAALRNAFPEELAGVYIGEELRETEPTIAMDTKAKEVLSSPVVVEVVAEPSKKLAQAVEAAKENFIDAKVIEKPLASDEDIAVIRTALSECKTVEQIEDVSTQYRDVYAYTKEQIKLLKSFKALALKGVKQNEA